MTSDRPRLAVLLLVAGAVASCSMPAADVPSDGGTSTPAVLPGQPALMAYERFWAVTDAAYAAPGSRDWMPELRDVATGQALETAKTDVENYTGLPAHTEGHAKRSPQIGQIAQGRVAITDCVDLGDSRLVQDTTGAVLDDLENRVPRYRFRAQVIDVGGRWLVEQATPALDEPC